jgi:hypothetical protein
LPETPSLSLFFNLGYAGCAGLFYPAFVYLSPDHHILIRTFFAWNPANLPNNIDQEHSKQKKNRQIDRNIGL